MRKTSMYFVQKNGVIEGPYSLEQVLALSLSKDTLVWKQGASSWTDLAEFEELNSVSDDTSGDTPPPLLVEFEEGKKYVEEVETESRIYFTHINNETKGPYTLEEMLGMGLEKDTLVWKSGMTSWLKAAEFSEFQTYFNSIPPAPPPADKKKDKEHNHKSSGIKWENLFLILFSILGLIFLVSVLLSNCSGCKYIFGGCSDTSGHVIPAPAPAPGPDTSKVVIDTAAMRKAHQHYLDTIEGKIEADFNRSGGYFIHTDKIQEQDTNQYMAYLKGMAVAIKENHKHIKHKHNSKNFIEYVDKITAFEYDYFKKYINGAANTGNLYDSSYLTCVNNIPSSRAPRPHPRPHTHPKPHPHPRPQPCYHCNTIDYTWYPRPYVGHYVNDIVNAYGKNLLEFWSLQGNFYTLTYEDNNYRATYYIDPASKICTEYTITFYNGKFYTGYLRQMFLEAVPLYNDNMSWTYYDQGREIEIDLEYLTNDCIQTLDYHYY